MNDFVGLPYEKDSNESRAAAASMVAHAPNQRQRIWEFLNGRGGATCDQVELSLDIVHASASTRLLELRRQGRIKKSGTRRTRSQRLAAVYVAVPRAEWTDGRPGWPTPGHVKRPTYGEGYTDGVNDAARLINAAGAALRGLRHEKNRAYPDGCWCDACLGNPMYPTHTAACKMAQEVMRYVETRDMQDQL